MNIDKSLPSHRPQNPMANYPSTPSFEVPFNYPNGHFPPAPPMGSFNNLTPQTTYPGYRDSMYHSQTAPNVHAQHMNQMAYNNNAQYPGVIPPGNDIPPPPSPYHGYGPFSSSRLPPPPFPPTPTPPYVPVAQRLAVPISQTASPSSLQPSSSLPPKPASGTTEAPKIDGQEKNELLTNGEDREDGELSDTELRRNGTSVSFVLPKQRKSTRIGTGAQGSAHVHDSDGDRSDSLRG